MRLLALSLLLALGLSACATRTAPGFLPESPGSAQKRGAHTEAVTRAQAMEGDGRLREAIWWWQVAEAVAPDPEAARSQVAKLNAEIARRVEMLVSEGDAARAKRATAKASAAYQQALALDPRSTRARTALREMETAAVLSAIGRFSGGPAAPRTTGRVGRD